MDEEKLYGTNEEDAPDTDAAMNSDGKDAAETTDPVKKTSGWKLWISAFAVVFALCIGIGSIGGNMFRMGRASDAASAEEYVYEAADGDYYYGSSVKSAAIPAEATAEVYDGKAYDYISNGTAEAAFGSSDDGMFNNSENAKKGETKLVKRASLSVQTVDFDETEKTLKQLVESLGGYFESSYQDNGGYYSDGSYKYGDYVIRIPAEKYDLFMNRVGEGCHISDLNESVEDIGEQYFDTESRLATLKTKLTRLQELLAQAKDMSDIIALESEISNTEYEIDSYTSTLNRYDSLVGYATISLNISLVSRVDDGIDNDNGFFAQLARRFKNGILNFIDSLADIAYWAAYNLIGIIIIVAAVIVIKKNRIFGRIADRFKRKK